MRCAKRFQEVIVLLATASLLASNVGVGFANESAKPMVSDVALGVGGTLAGQVVNVNGAAQANTQVLVRDQTGIVGRTATDKDGRFHLAGLRGGVYGISTEHGTVAYRTWAEGTAPPSAQQGVLLVDDGTTVRGGIPGIGVGPWIIIGGAIAIGVLAATSGS